MKVIEVDKALRAFQESVSVWHREKEIPYDVAIDFEIRVDDDLAEQSPFTEMGRTVTQKDFPAIVKVIRKQNRAEFGEGADRPD